MSIPRKHHYLPQCYLKNFSLDPKGQQIFVVDGVRKKSYISSIKDIAQKRDFNRIDFDNLDQNIIEKELAKFESELAPALSNIVCGGPFIKNTKDCILNLIALLAIRTPHMREHFSGFHKDVISKIMEIYLSSEERWNSAQSKYPKDERISYSDAQEFYKSKKYNIEISKEYLIQTEFKMAGEILKALHMRSWQLISTSKNEGIFITSDNPVQLCWDNPNDIPFLYRNSPGFGMTDTTVYFPLTKHHFLIGRFDKPDGYIEASKELITASNSQTTSFSIAQIFSPAKKVYLMDADHKKISLDSIFPIN